MIFNAFSWMLKRLPVSANLPNSPFRYIFNTPTTEIII